VPSAVIDISRFKQLRISKVMERKNEQQTSGTDIKKPSMLQQLRACEGVMSSRGDRQKDRERDRD